MDSMEYLKAENKELQNKYKKLCVAFNKYLSGERNDECTTEDDLEFVHAIAEGRIHIMPIAPGETYYAVMRDCNNCPYETDFYGMDRTCDKASDGEPHPWDGFHIEGCPVTPYIQERTFKEEDCNWVEANFIKKGHLFKTREEAEASMKKEVMKDDK